ncbi:MAG: hypothetical protein A3F72_19560 [Bacteroidetes bacterium RIFCSPLOWO2_12_FULL_35_15]|nr:MAG: hypothetical protein A3F72_19560 [Bacteroidetes bacterium RIFCSPLOWO2_12_FULL_35_15]
MKKLYLILVVCVLSVGAKAQYSQGDINVMPQPSMYHDFNICGSTCNLMYSITISNSFMGDSVKIKDQNSGSLIISDVNTTGANPWYVNLPVPIYNMMITDDQLAGGNANFFGPTVKVISGTDTVYNINNFYMLPVSNPCLYASVTGRVYIDNNTNCAFNVADDALSSIPVMSNSNLNSPSMSSTSSSAYSDGSGLYTMNVQQTWMTDYSVSIPSNYQFIFPSTACSPVVYSFTTLPQSNVDFSLQCTSNVDVQCTAGSSGIVRPNVPFYMFPSVSNTGCDLASGQLKLVLDNRVVYNPALSSVPAPTVSGDTLIWNYANLTNLTAGGYWNSFFANVHLTPNATVISGDNLCFRVLTNVPAADLNPSNNDYSFCLPVVNSYDPNFKEVSPKGIGATGGIDQLSDTILTYTVHFQNTGTAVAYNISIIDTLDSDIIPSSLEIVGSSHTVSPQWIALGVVKFNFYNIYLADSTSNEAASHGAITFRVKRQKLLPYGTQIKNTANIYFDFNAAVVTNTVINTIMDPTGIEQIVSDSKVISVYPNPFSDNTTFVIQSEKATEKYSFELFDVLGKKLKSINDISTKQFTISRNGLENGIYFYKIYSVESVVGIGKLIVN